MSPDFETLYCYKYRVLDLNKKMAQKVISIPINSIKTVKTGISTDILKRTGKKRRAKRYFSIITDERTLDLEAQSEEMAEFVGTRLTLLIIDLQKNSEWMEKYYDDLYEYDDDNDE